MNAKRVLLSLVVLLGAPCIAGADTILTFTPDPADMYDLDHHWVYEWGIDVFLPPDEPKVIEAKLTFYNIRNWNNGSNVLYVHLLNSCASGLHWYYDSEGGGDYFGPPENEDSEQSTHVVTYRNLWYWPPQDLTYTFTESDLDALNTYLADKRIGLGLDPDCHYWNDKIELTLVTPEPGSLAFFGVGALVLWRRARSAVC